MRPVAVYSALRVGLFLVVVLALRVLGVSGVLSLVIAVVVAMLLSFLVLRRQRDAVTRALMARDRAKKAAGRPRRRSFGDRLAEDAAAEDAATQDAATQGTATQGTATQGTATQGTVTSSTSGPAPAAADTSDVPGRRTGRSTP